MDIRGLEGSIVALVTPFAEDVLVNAVGFGVAFGLTFTFFRPEE